MSAWIVTIPFSGIDEDDLPTYDTTDEAIDAFLVELDYQIEVAAESHEHADEWNDECLACADTATVALLHNEGREGLREAVERDGEVTVTLANLFYGFGGWSGIVNLRRL